MFFKKQGLSIRMFVFFMALGLGPRLFAQDGTKDSAAPTPSVAAPNSESLPLKSKYTNELNQESSSFVADPDSLDPLPLKKESLKDEEEPVFDDIKSLIKNKEKILKPKIEKTVTEKKVKPKVEKKAKPIVAKVIKPKVKKVKPVPEKKVARKKPVRKRVEPSDYQDSQFSSRKSSPSENISDSNRADDEPDLNLEEKFHRVYKKYNEKPTSDEAWGQASSKTPNIYKVQRGDTLFTISNTLFGDSQFWPKIWSINTDITNPHRITPGLEINFYPGDAGNFPSIAISDPVVNPDDPNGPKLRSLGHQNTEFYKLVKIDGAKTKKLNNIPPSFPEITGARRDKKDYEAKIIFTPRQEIKETIPPNPYLLTADALAPQFKVLEKDASQLVCRENQFVPAATQIAVDAEPGSYLMITSEGYKFGRLKNTHLYRVIGAATISNVFSDKEKSLRVNNCIETLNSDILFVTRDKIQNLPVATEMINGPALQIIEGLDVYSQQFYYANQFVILNVNDQPVKDGDELPIYSETVGSIVGDMHIIKKSGTMAIGYIVRNNELIQNGDKVVLPK